MYSETSEEEFELLLLADFFITILIFLPCEWPEKDESQGGCKIYELVVEDVSDAVDALSSYYDYDCYETQSQELTEVVSAKLGAKYYPLLY